MKIVCLSVGSNGLGCEASLVLFGLEFYVYRNSRKVLSVGVAAGNHVWEKTFSKKK